MHSLVHVLAKLLKIRTDSFSPCSSWLLAVINHAEVEVPWCEVNGVLCGDIIMV